MGWGQLHTHVCHSVRRIVVIVHRFLASYGHAGVKNVTLLRQLVGQQRVPYDMGVYSLDFNVECPIISLSTPKSIIRGFVHVPFQPSATNPSVAGPLDTVDWDRIRYYLAVARQLDVEMRAEVIQQGELDYLQAKKGGNPQGLSVDDLDRWYTMARLVAASLGETGVELSEHWGRVKRLEEDRLHRVMSQARGLEGAPQ